MKKFISFLIVIALVFSLSACGGSDSPATITDKDGNVVQMTAKELCKLEEENSARFESLYYGANIVFVGTVKKVFSNARFNGSLVVDGIEFEEGWEVHLHNSWYDSMLLELNPGDKVKVTSQIYSVFGRNVTVLGMGSSAGYNKDTLKLTKLEIVK